MSRSELRRRPPRVRSDRTRAAYVSASPVATDQLAGHIHTWNVSLTEEDDFGSVRMYECGCGARHYATCA